MSAQQESHSPGWTLTLLFTDLARRMFRRAATQPRSTKPRRSTRLAITALEDRSMLAAITGLVFFDNNADGIQNQAEANASGIAVTLTPMTGSPTSTSTVNGSYAFSGLASGSYTVAFTAPAGYSVGNPVGGSMLVYVGTEDVNVGAGLVGEGTSPPPFVPPPSPPPPPSGGGDVFHWISTGSTDWTAPGNWDIGRVPTNTDNVYFDNAGSGGARRCDQDE